MDDIKSIIEDSCNLRVRLVVLKCLGIIILFKYIKEIIGWIANSNLNMNFSYLYFELTTNEALMWIIPTIFGLIQLYIFIHIFRKINCINYTIKECRFLRAWMVIPFTFIILNSIYFWIDLTSYVTFVGYLSVITYLYYILVLYAGLIFCIFFRSKVTYMYTIIFGVFILGFYLLYPYINCPHEVFGNSDIFMIYNYLIEIFFSGFDQYNTFFVVNAVLLIDEKLLVFVYRKVRSGLSFVKQNMLK